MNLSNPEKKQAPDTGFASKHDERVLVVKRTELFADDAWQGLKQENFDTYLSIIHQKKEFLPRGLMETDPTYKQIIPYLVYTHAGKLFLMQRDAKASEQRLSSKFSLGIGGHIRQEDMQGTTLADYAMREFHEEVSYSGSLNIEPLALLNDDSNAVGQVHIGFVFLVTGNSDQISIKSELQHGWMASLDECSHYYERMEGWSQLVFDHIRGLKLQK